MSATSQEGPEAPIFIGGCDRSGTTMLGSLLGGYPGCIVTPESPFKTDILTQQKGPGVRSGAETIELIRESWRFQIWQHQLAPATEPRTYAQAVQQLVSSYAVAHDRPATARWIDHTPNNIRYSVTILQQFPDAKFIHVVRDGRAVANSVMPLDWGPNTALFAAPWWAERLAYGLAAESSLGADTVLRVRYEDVLRDPDAQLQRISDFVGMDRQATSVGGAQYRSPEYTAGQHTLVGKPPDPSRLDHFRNTMTARDIELFEWATKDLLPYLGYTLDHAGRAVGPSGRERALAAVQENTKDRWNRLRNARRRKRAIRGPTSA